MDHSTNEGNNYQSFFPKSLSGTYTAFQVLHQLRDPNISFCYAELAEFIQSGKMIQDGCLEHLIHMYKAAGGTSQTETDIIMDLWAAYSHEMCVRHVTRLSNLRLDKIDRWERSGEKTVKIIKAAAVRKEPWNYAVVPARNAERFLIQVFPDMASAKEFVAKKGYILADDKLKQEIASEKQRVISSPIVNLIDRDSIKPSKGFSFKIPFYKLEAETGIMVQLSEHNVEKTLEFWVEYEDTLQACKHHLTANIWVTEPGGDFRERIDTISITTDEEIPAHEQVNYILQKLNDCAWLCEKTSAFISTFQSENNG